MTVSESFAQLRSIGITEIEAATYHLLLSNPGITAPELAQHLDVELRVLRVAVVNLERLGLVTRTTVHNSGLIPTAPDVGLEDLVLRREAELKEIRRLTTHLMDEFQRGRKRHASELIEVVSGPDVLRSRFEQLQRSARAEVQVLVTAPYASIANPVEFERLASGVTYRAIYDRATLETLPGILNDIARYVTAGETARLIDSLPLKLATFDRELGYIPLNVDQPEVTRVVLVRPCALLTALLYTFDVLWDQSIPLFQDHEPSLQSDNDPEGRERFTSHEYQILELLSAGMKDEAIARQLGTSHRTVRRHIAQMMEKLGVNSRFQLGLHFRGKLH